MLATARERLGPGVELHEARAEALPFPDASFDALTFTYLLRYVDDPAATLAELARVVRPGGTIAMLEFGLPRGLCARRPGSSTCVSACPTAGRLISPAWHDAGRILGPSIRGFHARVAGRSGSNRSGATPVWRTCARSGSASAAGLSCGRGGPRERGGAPRVLRARARRLARLRDAPPPALYGVERRLRRDRSGPRDARRLDAGRADAPRLLPRGRDRRARARRAAGTAAEYADPGRRAHRARGRLDRRCVRDRPLRRARAAVAPRVHRHGSRDRRRLQPGARRHAHRLGARARRRPLRRADRSVRPAGADHARGGDRRRRGRRARAHTAPALDIRPAPAPRRRRRARGARERRPASSASTARSCSRRPRHRSACSVS